MLKTPTGISPGALEAQTVNSEGSDRGRSPRRSVTPQGGTLAGIFGPNSSVFGLKAQKRASSESESELRSYPPVTTGLPVSTGRRTASRRQSWERKSELRIARPHSSEDARHKRRKSNASSFDGFEFMNLSRDLRRIKMLRYLNRHRHESVKGIGQDFTAALSDLEKNNAILDLAEECQTSGELIFNRFER